MALLFMDGFDQRDYLLKGWTPATTSGAAHAPISPGRLDGGSAVNISLTGGVVAARYCRIQQLFTPAPEIIFGIAVRPTYADNSSGFQISICADFGATHHLSIRSNWSTRVVELVAGYPIQSPTLLASSATILPNNEWSYLEIRATIADSGGVCQVRHSGYNVPIIDYTGDTKTGGTSTNIDAITLGAVSYNATGTVVAAYDDLYVLNTTGPNNNTWLGDVRVSTLLPNGNGADSQLVGSDADSVDNYLLVDEQPYDTADYTGSSVSGARDTYQLSNVPAGTTTVRAVQTNLVASKSDATSLNVSIPLRTGGNLYYGTVHPLSTSWLSYSDVHDINPDTSAAWTPSDVDGLETGMEVQ